VSDARRAPLVAAVEAALGTRVLALRYLPSPTAIAAALTGESTGAQHAPEVALDDLGEVHVAQPDLGRVLGPAEVDLASDDEPTR
jgi:hypothetical protein